MELVQKALHDVGFNGQQKETRRTQHPAKHCGRFSKTHCGVMFSKMRDRLEVFTSIEVLSTIDCACMPADIRPTRIHWCTAASIAQA